MTKKTEKFDIAKLLFYLLVFIIVSLSMVLFVIVPNVKEYRTSKNIYEKAFIYKSEVEKILKKREIVLKDLKSKNMHTSNSFEHKFSSENFITHASKFFTQVALIEINKKAHNKEFIEYELMVSSKLKSPTNFYVFLEGLNRYENIIQADFPIQMEANKNTIDSTFTLKVYNINLTK